MSRREFGGIFGLISLIPSLSSSQSTGESSMKRVTHGEISLATQAFGVPGDPALLMIMGATASMLGWPDALCAALTEHNLFVIRFDHRDTGQSTTVPLGQASYAVEDLAADAIAVLDAYGINQAHVLGMSLGGFIGQMIALDYPERVKSLTLLASEPLGWDGAPLPHIAPAFLEHFAGLQALDWSNDEEVTHFLVTSERLSAGSAHPFDEKAVRARITEVLKRAESPASMFNHAMITLRQDWKGRFRDISIPVLVLHGEEDPVLPVENGLAIADGIVGAEFVGLPGVGHEIPAALIDDMSDRIARFLD
jgi:pimeloyl-ACP methyl ester carboxylesterase